MLVVDLLRKATSWSKVGGEAFQETSNVDIIVFDKTGTLTEGKMQVTNFEMLKDTELTALALAFSKGLEEASTHPIAAAIADHCDGELKKHPGRSINASDVKEVPGSGMSGKFLVKAHGVDNEAIYEAHTRKPTLSNVARQSILHDTSCQVPKPWSVGRDSCGPPAQQRQSR